jgi:selenoprotein W-related protein
LAEDILNDHWKTIDRVALVPSSGGVFEITLGDTLIYSKKQTGKFPEPEQVMQQIAD